MFVQSKFCGIVDSNFCWDGFVKLQVFGINKI